MDSKWSEMIIITDDIPFSERGFRIGEEVQLDELYTVGKVVGYHEAGDIWLVELPFWGMPDGLSEQEEAAREPKYLMLSESWFLNRDGEIPF